MPDDIREAPVTPSPRTANVALLFMIIGAIFWLGGVNIRAIIGNDMLKPGSLSFEEYVAPEAEREIYRLISFSPPWPS